MNSPQAKWARVHDAPGPEQPTLLGAWLHNASALQLRAYYKVCRPMGPEARLRAQCMLSHAKWRDRLTAEAAHSRKMAAHAGLALALTDARRDAMNTRLSPEARARAAATIGELYTQLHPRAYIKAG